ncbi:DUF3152 domain-containing protein [Streptomyces sp. NBC_00083]|uniref:DUF3152 domain-containing protein n=1 Tax=Streptomyces sp. NBC_00083 TaxID=2975647 RepID=UPI00224EF2C8|nr:DUF3152 domain-containing protein [Streptomyces sp. NBC_00083]MCX5385497.1 DUF3152 domain-containing protein [Streptomyces sp. NBC_00083]
MGRHSRPKESGEAAPIPQAPQAPEAEPAGASGSGRRRRRADDAHDGHHDTAGTPASGTPRVRGGHPQHHEDGPGGAAARYGDRRGTPRPAQRDSRDGGTPRIPGPRRSYTEAFDGPDTRSAAASNTVAVPTVPVPLRDGPNAPAAKAKGSQETGAAKASKVSKGRTFTGIAAAAVTTVLAVVVAGQVTSDDNRHDAAGQSAADKGRDDDGSASRGSGRSTPQAAPAVLTYDQKMAQQFPLDAKLKGPGDFETVPGAAAAPGKGRKYRYRVDLEKGLGLDGALFAEAVQKTLNDDRSWSHNGAMTFERISSGKPDFVVTLASPGTTGVWCQKSGLDTTEDNVSCDSAATDRVMINAFRWAQGSETFGWGKAMVAYRQMLINHEVGHRLGHNHVSCRTPGALAPVMQQQTKSLDIDGIACRPNPWVYPTS